MSLSHKEDRFRVSSFAAHCILSSPLPPPGRFSLFLPCAAAHPHSLSPVCDSRIFPSAPVLSLCLVFDSSLCCWPHRRVVPVPCLWSVYEPKSSNERTLRCMREAMADLIHMCRCCVVFDLMSCAQPTTRAAACGRLSRRPTVPLPLCSPHQHIALSLSFSPQLRPVPLSNTRLATRL